MHKNKSLTYSNLSMDLRNCLAIVEVGFILFCGASEGYSEVVRNKIKDKVKLDLNVSDDDGDVCLVEQKFPVFEQSSAMRLETICMMKCLEEVHYSRKKLRNLDFKKVIEEYITQLDSMKMFFSRSDVDGFIKRFASSLDIFLTGGSLTPGFSIFELLRSRLQDRVKWIFKVLEQEKLNLNGNGSFLSDREKEDWRPNGSVLDTLWRDRLTFELINEILLLDYSKYSKNCSLVEETFNCFNNIGECKVFPCKKCNIDLKSFPFSESSENRGNIFASCWSKFDRYFHFFEPYKFVYNQNALERMKNGKLEIDSYEKKLEKALNILRKRYNNLLKNIAQIEPWIIQEQFVNSVTKSFDPHTIFMATETVEDLRTALHNSFVGIGAYLSDDNGSCVIKELVPGGPAFKSKSINVGDKIIGIKQENGPEIDVTGMLLNKVVKMLRGVKGSKVILTLQPTVGDISSKKRVTLVREDIELTESRASAKIFEIQEGNKIFKIGFLVLPGFYGASDVEPHSTCSDDVRALLEKLKSKGVECLILDLRDNSGGLLDESVKIGGLFIGKGPIVQVRGQYGNVEHLDAQEPSPLWAGPLIVLTSRMSASASEVLAGALKDYGRAVIVGDESTHGKGSVQALLPMDQLFPKFRYKDSLGAAKVTIQKWYRPSGVSTQIKGVRADIALPSSHMLLPIGEGSIPHALEWDKIDALTLNNNFRPISEDIIKVLAKKSIDRQNKDSEFNFLQKQVSFAKKSLDKKEYSLNLHERRKEKDDNVILEKSLLAQQESLGKIISPKEEIVLDSPNKKTNFGNQPKLEKKVDIPLHESIRIAVDLLKQL